MSHRHVLSILSVVLLPRDSNIHVGDDIVVRSTVSDMDGPLGTGQCVLIWRDTVAGRRVQPDSRTACDGTFKEPAASVAGVHHITARSVLTLGGPGKGSDSVDVTVARG